MTRILATATLLWFAASPLSAQIRIDLTEQTFMAAGDKKPQSISGGQGRPRSIVIKGDRRLTTNDLVAELIDLRAEQLYLLDLRRKTYTVTSFEELRRRDPSQLGAFAGVSTLDADALFDQQRRVGGAFKRNATGQRQRINGYDAQEVLTTLKMTVGELTMIMDRTEWLTADVPGYEAVGDFDRRYADKLNGSHSSPPVSAPPDTLTAANPVLDQVSGVVNDDGSTGVPVRSTYSMRTERSPVVQESADEEEGNRKTPAKSGFGGKLRRRMFGGGRPSEAEVAEWTRRQEENERSKTPSVIIQTELVKVSTEVSDADVSIPETFRPQRRVDGIR